MSNLGGIGALGLTRDPLRERRSHRRKSVLSELGELVVVTLGSERGLLLSLSAGGISVQTQSQLTPGSNLSVQFLLPFTQACINLTCVVVWTNDKCEAGLRFLQLAERERLALEDWMAVHCEAPEDVLSRAAPNGVSVPLSDAFAQTAYGDLAAAIQALMGHEPDASCDEPPAAAEPAAQEDFLLHVVAQARSLTDAEGAALILRGEEGIICRASAGNAPAVGSRLRPDSGLSGECFRRGQAVRCDDVENDCRVNSAAAQRLRSRSILIVPILGKESTRGILQVLSSQPSAFHPAHVVSLEHLAGLVASFLAEEGEVRPSDLAPEFLSEPEAAVEPAVQEKARQPEPALNLPSEPGAAESIEPAQVPVETAVEERVEQPDAGLEVSSEPQVAAEPAVEERAQQLEPAPDLLSESPEAASTEPIESATELEAADAPAVQLTSAEQRDGETDQETSIAAAAAVPDVPLIAIVDTKSPPRIPRYVAIVGALGLLIGASLAIFYGPQSNSAAQHTSSVQLEPIPLPTQPATASQPKPVENANAAKKDTPTRPVSAPLRHDVVAQTVRRQPQRVDAPRLAAPAVPAPVVQLNSDKAIRNSSAMAGNKPAQSEGELPPALTPADAGKPAPIATIVRAPVPTPVLAPPRGPVRVSEGVVRGRAISQAKPIYPQAALNTRIQGSVVLNATIGTDGTIKKLQVVTGNPYLAGAALDAVKKWRYQPYYLDGVPVEVESTITLNFRLP